MYIQPRGPVYDSSGIWYSGLADTYNEYVVQEEAARNGRRRPQDEDRRGPQDGSSRQRPGADRPRQLRSRDPKSPTRLGRDEPRPDSTSNRAGRHVSPLPAFRHGDVDR